MPAGFEDEWRERIRIGAARLSMAERISLIERLVVAHESYDEIMASWQPELRRRIEEIDSGHAELIPMEVTLAKIRALIENAPRHRKPRIPVGIEEIEDHALHLPNDDFFLLLVDLESSLREETDPQWRADIQRRIAAIPAEVQRRYRECNGDWEDDD